MPLYEYECEACGRRFEVIQKYSDPPVEQCTTCSGKVRKLLSSPAIQFKGSGWYVTDYAKKAPASSGAADSSSASKSDSSGAKPSDSGAAGSSESKGS
ncbi:MAG TPA: FmdB family zinc ribbon protein [Vicinamibacterales bacterium]|nr:FmdB family zinc ribbon protein [Vicinamibacterales bacterium]